MLSNLKDNQGAVQLSQNPMSDSHSKYIDVRHNVLRELVRQGDISVNRVRSEYQHADILTKALAFDVFVIHRRFLMNLGVQGVYLAFAVDRRFDVCMLISVCFFVCVRLLVL